MTGSELRQKRYRAGLTARKLWSIALGKFGPGRAPGPFEILEFEDGKLELGERELRSLIKIISERST
jgi:hypothetical protein